MSASVEVEIEGRRLSLSNLDKVLYPSGFTKAQVIDYLTRIAPVAIPASVAIRAAELSACGLTRS